MNNIGIILNQDNNNQSYLGKFYQRNQLEFPVIRKIYEQSESSKNLIINNNQNILENNNLNEYKYSILTDPRFSKIFPKYYIKCILDIIEDSYICLQ